MLITIVGPTASGKSELALKLTLKYNGQIISADSRAIYKGFDIGTAKPSKTDQAKVRHYLIDIVEPTEVFSVAQFKTLANQAIQTIERSGHLPFLVGGSGLYIDAVLFDYQFRGTINMIDRKKLKKDTLILGLNPNRPLLKQKIAQRTDTMLNKGLVQEVKKLLEIYGRENPLFTTIGYDSIVKFLNQKLTLAQARDEIIKETADLAKRQVTWLKRNPYIYWIKSQSQAEKLIDSYLKKP